MAQPETIRAPIDWSRLGRATDFYRRLGFVSIETPWRVHRSVVDATIPKCAHPFRCDLDPTRPNYLVGSAEQGFLSIMSTLTPGPYQSLSPCFRDNEIDELHFSDFMKLEICVVGGRDDAAAMLGLAAELFAQSEGLRVHQMSTDIGFDLVNDEDIEVGSYGWRRVVVDGIEHTWAYGTGLAEPRFSQAIRGIK